MTNKGSLSQRALGVGFESAVGNEKDRLNAGGGIGSISSPDIQRINARRPGTPGIGLASSPSI